MDPSAYVPGVQATLHVMYGRLGAESRLAYPGRQLHPVRSGFGTCRCAAAHCRQPARASERISSVRAEGGEGGDALPLPGEKE